MRASAVQAASIGVSITPGLTLFAVIPKGPEARAIAFVNAVTPALDAAYDAPAARPPV